MLADARKSLGLILKPIGFRKVANEWHRDLPEIIQVVELQKSQYDNSGYLNMGICLKAAGIPPTIKERHCHIRERLESLVGRWEPWPLGDEGGSHAREMIETMKRVGIPFLTKCETIDGIRDIIREGLITLSWITAVGRDYLHSSYKT